MAGDKEHPASTVERDPAAAPARRGYAISRIEAPPAAATNPQLHSAGPPANRAAGRGGGGAHMQASGDSQQQLKDDSGRGGDGGGKGRGRGRRKRGGKGGSAQASSGGKTTMADGPSGGGLDRKPGSPRPAVAPPPPNRQRSPRAHQQHASRGEGGFGAARDTGTNRSSRQYYHEHDDRTEVAPAGAGAGAGRKADRQHQRTNPNSENTAQAQAQSQAHTSKPRTDRDTRGKPYSVRGRGGDSTSGSSGSNGGSIFSRLGPPPGSPRNELTRGDGSGHGDRNTRARGGAYAQHLHSPQGAPGASSSHAGHGAASMPKPHSPRAPKPAGSADPATTATANSKGRPQQQSKHETASSHSSARGGSGGGKPSSFLSGRAGHERLNGDSHGHGGRGGNNRHVNSRDGNDNNNNRNNSRGDKLGRGKANRLSEASGARGNATAAATAAPVSKARDNAQHQPHQKQSRRPQQQQHQHQQHCQEQEQEKEQPRGRGDYARGTCIAMCPESEMREREAEGGLSSFEATEATAKASVPFRNRVADPEKAVKKYRRSAAGRNMQSPQQLRPLAVLQTTARYLVKDVFAKACSNSISDNSSSVGEQRGRSSGPSSIAKAYAFVEDRLRAVRQDLTVQGLVLAASEGAAEVLKTAANFYIVAGYLMVDEASDVFDQHLHTRELQGVLSSLGDLFFQARGAVVPHVPDEPFQALGVDEYLCLQAVHALATAITNTSKGGDTQLGLAAGGQGVGRLVTTTVSKLCSSSSVSSANGSAGDRSTVAAVAAATTAGAEAAKNGGTTEGLDMVSPLSEPFRSNFPKMAVAVRLLGVVGAGNWSEFFRVLGVDSASTAPESGGGGGGGGIDGDGGSSRGESGLRLVAGELASSSFAVRLRCLCHGMLLPVRAHALRAMNMAFGKSEKVPLADVARMLRTRDEDHAAGICRALSLPIDENETHKSESNSGSNSEDGVVWSVVFKSVPAVWRSEKAKAEGYCSSDATAAPQQHPQGLKASLGAQEKRTVTSSAREDDFVGLTRAFAVAVADNTNNRKEDSPATVTCDACAGFGCSWCENGVVKAEEVVLGGEEEGLWEAALRPT